VLPSDRADLRLRFFTPTRELPLAGHPTVAAWHALVEQGRIALSGRRTRRTQELQLGVLPVELEAGPDGRLARVWMTQPAPQFLRTYPPDRFAAALGVPISGLEPDYPLQTVSAGAPQLMFPVRSLHVLERLEPDLGALAALSAEGDFLGVHVFAPEGYEAAAAAHARHFAPAAGIAEDPVTGSANGALGAYLVHYGLALRHEFSIEQGHIIGRPGTVHVEVERDGDEGPIAGVRIGGSAVTVYRGRLTSLPALP
ncbi:MAG TPA: PhzF family phenazine biosynthesis protein, partial [Dehalococcoidia bacterium]|nr:PhzF family phenazine biosynthesis protein [Dehalococcoidia bacterium]